MPGFPNRSKPFPQVMAIVWCLVVPFFLFPAGCGKKGPPLPPEAYQEAHTSLNLEVTKVKNLGVLHWQAPREKGRIKGFDVFMEKIPVSGCSSCKTEFRRIARIPLQRSPYRIEVELEEGMLYRFRVTGIDREGGELPVSETRRLDPDSH